MPRTTRLPQHQTKPLSGEDATVRRGSRQRVAKTRPDFVDPFSLRKRRTTTNNILTPPPTLPSEPTAQSPSILSPVSPPPPPPSIASIHTPPSTQPAPPQTPSSSSQRAHQGCRRRHRVPRSLSIVVGSRVRSLSLDGCYTGDEEGHEHQTMNKTRFDEHRDDLSCFDQTSTHIDPDEGPIEVVEKSHRHQGLKEEDVEEEVIAPVKRTSLVGNRDVVHNQQTNLEQGRRSMRLYSSEKKSRYRDKHELEEEAIEEEIEEEEEEEGENDYSEEEDAVEDEHVPGSPVNIPVGIVPTQSPRRQRGPASPTKHNPNTESPSKTQHTQNSSEDVTEAGMETGSMPVFRIKSVVLKIRLIPFKKRDSVRNQWKKTLASMSPSQAYVHLNFSPARSTRIAKARARQWNK